MRKAVGSLVALAVFVGACGEPAARAPTTENTIPEATTSTTELAPPTTSTSPASTTSTSVVVSQRWTVTDYGTNPSVVMGDRGELGSGCSPGTDVLPDGIWFGWLKEKGEATLAFDLACLWPGRLEPAASNDAPRLRQLPVAPEAKVYLYDGSAAMYDLWDGEATPAENAPGLQDGLPFWLFINDGYVTEVAEHPGPVTWARSTAAWPGLLPGCCDGGDVAPASPSDPWPTTGWPADGFYKAWVTADGQSWIDLYDELSAITISKWLSCEENPGLCPEWWEGDEVTTELEGDNLIRSLAFSPELSVVIMPISSEAALVGDGVAFGELIADMNQSVDAWDDADLWALSENPAFPFGPIPWQGEPEWGELGYRGPGGAHLTWFGGWLALEIRNGLPILYIHAGLVAG